MWELFFAVAMAAEPKVVEIPSINVDRVVVRAGITSTTGAKDSHLNVHQRAGNSIIVKSIGLSFPDVRVEGRDLIVENQGLGNLEISGPSREIAIFWAVGEVALNNWAAPITALGQKSVLKVQGGEGQVKVFITNGKVSIQGRKGNITVDGNDVETSVDGGDGDLWIGTRQGKTDVRARRGKLVYSSYQGGLTAKDHRGPLEFTSHLGAINLDGFEGSVRGVATDGSIMAKVKDPVDFRVQAREGRVTLTVPPGTGATLLAETKDADIIAPKSIRVRRDEDLRIAQGDLPGANRGFISIKTESSLIRIKTE